VDRMIGELVHHMEQQGAWDDALVVVTSDHGVAISPPHFTRSITDATRDEVLRVPLFVKTPGQVRGEARDDPASTIDVLPTIVDALDIETEWAFDGHSLLDGSPPLADRTLESDLESAFAVVDRQESRFPPGGGWVELASIGPWGELVGTPVAELRVGDPSDLTWSLDHREALAGQAAVPRARPVLMTG